MKPKHFEDEWFTHPAYSDILVSSRGVILSYKRGSWYELQQSDNGLGYLRVGVGHGNPNYVHVLVAETFVYNDDTRNQTQVNHIDGDKQNNDCANLEWVTPTENMKHAFQTGLKQSSPGRDVKVIETGRVYTSIAECARQIGGDQRNISLCLSNKRQTHMGFHFEYWDGERFNA